MANLLPRVIKRGRYNDYTKYKAEIPKIIDCLRKTKRGDITGIHQVTGIPLSTISRWHRSLCLNPRFNPLDKKYGQHKRIFTDEEEDSLADYIVDNYIIPGHYFTDDDFRELALQAWKEKYIPILNSSDPEIRSQYKEFTCSRGFIYDFKYHHHFSSKVFSH